jgi:hypothetical protein
LGAALLAAALSSEASAALFLTRFLLQYFYMPQSYLAEWPSVFKLSH